MGMESLAVSRNVFASMRFVNVCDCHWMSKASGENVILKCVGGSFSQKKEKKKKKKRAIRGDEEKKMDKRYEGSVGGWVYTIRPKKETSRRKNEQ